MDYNKLFLRFCKAQPKFFREPYFKFDLIEKGGRQIKRLTTYVDTGRVHWRGMEYHEYDVYMTNEDCLKQYITEMMRNKSFLDYFDMIHYDSLEELEIKLSVIGF